MKLPLPIFVISVSLSLIYLLIPHQSIMHAISAKTGTFLYPVTENCSSKSAFANDTRNATKKFAYVFYVTSDHYACYALTNAHRLIIDLRTNSSIDIVFVATRNSGLKKFCPNWTCPPPLEKIKIKIVPEEIVERSRWLAKNDYYSGCYIRFEAFGLYEDGYDRLVIMDSDGWILRNLDHLFDMEMTPWKISAALAHYIDTPWISSTFLVVEPSLELYDEFQSFLNPQNLSALSYRSHFDMDILNYALEEGNRTRILPKYYALLDSYFLEGNRSRLEEREETELNETFYIHFSHRKPLLYPSTTRPWPIELNWADKNQRKKIGEILGKFRGDFRNRVHVPLWKLIDMYCRNVLDYAGSTWEFSW